MLNNKNGIEQIYSEHNLIFYISNFFLLKMSSRNSASNSLTALANLTATYTDSENEDDNRSDDEGSRTDASTESQVAIACYLFST